MPNVGFDGGIGDEHVIHVGSDTFPVEYGDCISKAENYRKINKDYGLILGIRQSRLATIFAGCHAFGTRAACYASIAPNEIRRIVSHLNFDVATDKVIVVSARTRYLADDWPVADGYSIEAIYEGHSGSWVRRS
jgi:hypothetical protein